MQLSLPISAVAFRCCIYRKMSLVSRYEISGLKVIYEAVQAGLCLTRRETADEAFSQDCAFPPILEMSCTYNMAFVPSKASDQPGHLPSLISESPLSA